MKSYIKIIALLLVNIACVCFFSACFTRESQKKSEEEIARNSIKLLSKLEVPIDSTIVYHIRDTEEHHYQDTDYQYVVFKFKSEPTEWLLNNSFENSSNKIKREIFEGYFKAAVEKKPTHMETINHQYLPNYGEFYYYLLTNNVYFMFDTQKQLLIVVVL